MMPAVERTAITVFFLVYLAAAFAWPTWRIWQRAGSNPYVLPTTDDAYGFVTQGFRMVLGTLTAYIVLQALWPSVDALLGTLSWLAQPVVRLAAWSGLLVALVWTVMAQYQMGLSWRIGIDQQRSTALVTAGLFGCSRNPIFLGMRVSLFCLTLLLPNALTMSAWLAADLLMQLQVRLEEDFLETRHGVAYAQYRQAVRRWL